MMDKRIEILGDMFGRFTPEEAFICLGLTDDNVFMFADKDKDPRQLMSVIESILENDEWLRMVITGSMLGLMAADPKYRSEFMGVYQAMKEHAPKRGN